MARGDARLLFRNLNFLIRKLKKSDVLISRRNVSKEKDTVYKIMVERKSGFDIQVNCLYEFLELKAVIKNVKVTGKAKIIKLILKRPI